MSVALLRRGSARAAAAPRHTARLRACARAHPLQTAPSPEPEKEKTRPRLPWSGQRACAGVIRGSLGLQAISRHHARAPPPARVPRLLVASHPEWARKVPRARLAHRARHGIPWSVQRPAGMQHEPSHALRMFALTIPIPVLSEQLQPQLACARPPKLTPRLVRPRPSLSTADYMASQQDMAMNLTTFEQLEDQPTKTLLLKVMRRRH